MDEEKRSAYKCRAPEEVNPQTDYLAYLNGEGRPRFVEHLRTCEYCQEELAVARHAADLLHQNFRFIISPGRAMCVEPHELGDYLLARKRGSIESAEQRKIGAHLAACPYCQQEAGEISEWLELPDEVLVGVASSPKSGGSGAGLAGLRRIVATWLDPEQYRNADLALRDMGNEDYPAPPGQLSRPLLFQAEDLRVIIMAQPAESRPGKFKLRGHLELAGENLEEDLSGEVRLVLNGAPVACQPLDDLGHFVFKDVPSAANFELEIVLPGRVVVVPGVTVP